MCIRDRYQRRVHGDSSSKSFNNTHNAQQLRNMKLACLFLATYILIAFASTASKDLLSKVLPDQVPPAALETIRLKPGEVMCMMACMDGYYMTSPCKCMPCPSWCATCFGPNAADCSKPKPPAQCFVGCRPGNFQAYPCDCIPCADGCKACTGPKLEHCIDN
eukprot:TRINITY_DN2064_c0_g1_i13.p1 TRINITY_DN2064_c0_g1~~TRINITY_DN2064_c0_g1_i13.p1  ORF type:complete len:162 (+),score=31.73 TRINITY_DN2064_c0_g1_i13:80-565(+)